MIVRRRRLLRAAPGLGLSWSFAGGAVARARSVASASDAALAAVDRRLRVGVVGGRFGAAFQFHDHPSAVVTAVSDLRPDRRARLQRVYRCERAHESLDLLLRDPDVDAVALFTPAPDHLRHTVACLRAGKHVLCAVPAVMSLEEADELRARVEQSGLVYMMAETSYFSQAAISARRLARDGAFGTIFFTEAEYHHDGIAALWFEDGKPTWRHGLPPMLYPTHTTAFLVGVTGERLARVSCTGWGDGAAELKGNRYGNPFWNETAFFTTDRGHALRASVYWKGAQRPIERAAWYGDKLSLHMRDPKGLASVIVRPGAAAGLDDAGFARGEPVAEIYDQPRWYLTDLLPEPLRRPSGHDHSHPFITHEFVDAVLARRRPAIDVYEALAYTVPGIVAHRSALRGGEQLRVPGFDRRR